MSAHTPLTHIQILEAPSVTVTKERAHSAATAVP